MKPLRATSAVVVLALVLLPLAGCAMLTGEEPPPPVQAGPSPEQQARYAQAESRLNSPEPSVRQQAATALLAMNHPDALQAVFDRLRRSSDPAVRASMIQAVAFAEDPRCFDAVLEAVQDPDATVRRQAALALARFTDPEQVQAMMERTRDVPAQQRQLLYEALGEGLALNAVPVLIEGLGARQQEVQAAALAALRRISGRDFAADAERWQEWWAANRHRTREDVLEEHLRAMSTRLEARSRDLQNLEQQQQELMRLVRSVQSDTVPLLVKALDSDYDLVREYAAHRLAQLPSEQLSGVRIDDAATYTTLAQALGDPSEQVRRNVLRFVLNTEGDYRDRLVMKALGDESPTVLVPAVEAVRAEMGSEAVHRLEELLKHADARVREAAANVLGRVGSQDCVPALMAALDDAEPNVRWFAVEGLRKLQATQAVPRVSQLLEADESARVREIAASTLGELGQPAGVPALRQALRDPNERVRQKAAAALKTLATGSYERMAVIAEAFQQQRLHAEAQEIWRRVIATYGSEAAMQNRVVEAHRSLAESQRAQGNYSAASTTWQELDDLLGGSIEVRRNAVRNWLEAGEPARTAAALERWLGTPEAPPSELIELALSAAERMFLEGHEEAGAQVLSLVDQAAGETMDGELKLRIERLERRSEQ